MIKNIFFLSYIASISSFFRVFIIAILRIVIFLVVLLVLEILILRLFRGRWVDFWGIGHRLWFRGFLGLCFGFWSLWWWLLVLNNFLCWLHLFFRNCFFFSLGRFINRNIFFHILFRNLRKTSIFCYQMLLISQTIRIIKDSVRKIAKYCIWRQFKL